MARRSPAHVAAFLFGAALFVSLGGPLQGAEVFDEVTLKDGSKIVGEIVSMVDGELEIKTAFGIEGTTKVQWSEVSSIRTAETREEKVTLVLKDGSTIVGTARPGDDGLLTVTSDASATPLSVSVDNITAVNPPPTRAVTFTGNLSLGASMQRGNTNTRSVSFVADFELRHERHRVTLGGLYNYADDDESGVTAQYGKAGLKYDFFVTDRFYVYANGMVEHDGLQDLSLRTLLGAGPGYQLIDKGDFTADWVKDLQLYVEAGVSYLNKDYKQAEDVSTVTARWAVKLDWPIVPDKVTLFHFHEGYPSFDGDEFYIYTEQGVRLKIWGNFIGTLQINWRYDSNPAPGFERGDTIYLATLGYSFEY